MMRKARAFRPAASERLEDRVVLSDIGFNGSIVTVPTRDAQAVVKAFGAFDQAYSKDAQTILLAPGTTNPAGNRTAFDAQVGKDLAKLNAAIDQAIANLPTASNAQLAATIKGDLLGAGTSTARTLQSRLASIPTPGATSGSALTGFQSYSESTISRVSSQVAQLVGNATPPAGTITQATANTLLGSFNSPFEAFGKGYLAAVQSTATAPSTNRPAFDQAVTGLLTTLNGGINAALTKASLPPSVTSFLTTTLKNDLLKGGSTTGSSLQAELAALAAPTGTKSPTAEKFVYQSLQTILAGQAQTAKDVIAAIDTYNTSLGSAKLSVAAP